MDINKGSISSLPQVLAARHKGPSGKESHPEGRRSSRNAKKAPPHSFIQRGLPSDAAIRRWTRGTESRNERKGVAIWDRNTSWLLTPARRATAPSSSMWIPRSSASRRRSSRSTSRSPAGSSTTRKRFGAPCTRSCEKLSSSRDSSRVTSPPSASRTSARRRSSGTERRDGRSTTPSSGSRARQRIYART